MKRRDLVKPFFLLLAMLLAALLVSTTNIHAQHSLTAKTDAKSVRAEIEEALTEAISQNRALLPAGEGEFELGELNVDGDYGLLNAQRWPNQVDENAHVVMPTILLAAAFHDGQGWKVSLEGSSEYEELLVQLPDTLLDSKSRTILLAAEEAKREATSESSTDYHFRGLPWTVGTRWKLSQDLHGSLNNAFDFATLDGNPGLVRAVDEGTVVGKGDTCIIFKRSDNVYHGYQHIQNSDIANWELGDSVDYQTEIGNTTTASGCSGPSTGHNVHFWIYDEETKSNQKLFDPTGSTLNGWVLTTEEDESETPAEPDSELPRYGWDYPLQKNGEFICAESGGVVGQTIQNGEDRCTGHEIMFEAFEACPAGVGAGVKPYNDDISAHYVQEAICTAYSRYEGLLGNPKDDVYEWGRYQAQEFDSNRSELGAVIIFNPVVRTAFVVLDEVWNYYREEVGGVNGQLAGPVTDHIITQNADNEIEREEVYFEDGFIRYIPNRSIDTIFYSGNTPVINSFVFLDVPKTHTFRRYIDPLPAAGITQSCATHEGGYGTFFCPERFITRGELALMVAHSVYGPNFPSVGNRYSHFEDVQGDDDFVRAIEALARDGLLTPYEGHPLFQQEQNVTRAEAMSIIMEALMFPSNMPEPEGTKSFPDVDNQNEYGNAILLAAEFGIVDGYSDGRFRPNTFATRGQVAKMLCNAFLSSGECGSSVQERRGWSYVAPGIKWRTPFEYEEGDDIKRETESNIAVVDLEVSGVHVELAHDFKNRVSGQFNLKNIYNLVKDSGAKQSGERFYPFVSINGTAFECNGTVATDTFWPTWTQTEKYAVSILGIDHIAYGPEQPSTDHLVGGWWSGFFFYDENSNIASIHSPRKEPGFPYEHPEHSRNSSRRQQAQDYIIDKIGISDFAVGYEKVILYDGIPSTEGTEVGDKHKTAIGIGNRNARGTDKARYLFLATAHADVSLRDFANQLKNAGARYAILLDGGGSSQFLSAGRNGAKYNQIKQNRCQEFLRLEKNIPRVILNSIVVYNELSIPEREKQIYPSGGTYSLDHNIEIEFRQGTFFGTRSHDSDLSISGPTDDYVTLNYAQQPQPISTTLLQDIGVFYELHANHQDDSPANPQKPYTLTISYDPQRLPGRVTETNLALYFWNGSEWEREPTGIVNADENRVIATPNKFGSWAVFAPASLEQLTTNSPSYAGPHNEPNKIIIRVTKPALSLTKDDFSVTVDGRAANIITFYQGSDEYVLEVLPPTQSANGLYDLDVSVTAGGITLSDLEQDAVLYSESNNIDVALVIDRSGSMGTDYMASAQNAAKQFVDFMFDNDQVGVVSFSSSARVDFGLAPVTSGAGGSREQAKNAIDALASGGGTSIGGGLELGQNELTSKGDATHPWAMVLLSDGAQNQEPLVADVLPDIVTTKTIVHTVALGPQSDQALLLDIATQTGGTYNLAPTAEQLQEVYNTIAGTVSGQQALLTQTGIVKAGETDEKNVVVDSTISEATFSVRWSNSTSNLELELTAPDGTVINPTVSASTSDMVYVSGSTYAYYRIKSPTLSAGVWKMKITGGIISGRRARIHGADPEEQYTAEVTGQPTGAAVTINSYFDDGTTYQTDDPVLVSITLSDDQPILGAEVVAIVGPLLTGSSPARTVDQQTDPILVLYDDGAHGDGQANDGVYANVLGGDSTETPGLYSFQIFATGTANNGETFARRTQQNVNVGVSQNPINANRQAEGLNLFLPLIMD